MTVKIVPSDASGFRYFCESCGRDLGSIDKNEAVALLSGRYGPTLCFDCDRLIADTVPDALYFAYYPGILKVGNKWFCIDPWNEASEQFKAFVKLLNDTQQAWEGGVRPVAVAFVASE